MFHFEHCNCGKKVLKIKTQGFKVQYSALKFKGGLNRGRRSGQVRINVGSGLDSSDDVQMWQQAAGY